jgi:hypothetical protein
VTADTEPAHLRAEWALALLTHCPQHRDVLGHPVDDVDVAHLSPARYVHINL